MSNPSPETSNSLRRRLYQNLQPTIWPYETMSPINRFLVLAIITSVVVAVLETEDTLRRNWWTVFEILNGVFLGIFSLEYLIRLWTAGEDPKYEGFLGRLRYMISPVAIIDLLAIVPFAIGLLGSESFVMRVIRLARIFILFRLERYLMAMRSLREAFAKRKYEMAVAVGAALLSLFLSAVALYLAERTAQPEHFGSIPRALWWGMETLTTVGYGDVYPITVLGKIFAGVFAMAGIGLLALPTGIMAAAFSEAFQQRRR